MEKKLNIEVLESALEKLGMSQAALAKHLNVSRESVSKWFSGESFPRPDKLLRLGTTLHLSFKSLVLTEDLNAPRIAFRKVKGTKTTAEHVTRAMEMGRMLRELVSYLPFDKLVTPPVLKEPRLDYQYLKEVGASVRRSMGLGLREPVAFPKLVKRFLELQTVLVPVLWGERKKHENATHIFLPDSRTTWVYLNLDVNTHDFLFWMAHELGHSFSPQLEGDVAEDFADAFAGELVFSGEVAAESYAQLLGKPPGRQINIIKELAEQFCVSPFCVFKQVNAYAKHVNASPLHLESIHGATTNFNRDWLLVSQALFQAQPPKPEVYIRAAKVQFESPFFEALENYLRASGRGPGFVQTVLDAGVVDAKAIHAELVA